METRLQRERRLRSRKSPIEGRSSGSIGNDEKPNIPAAGFKAGKRHKGHSPLRVKPRDTARAIPFDVISPDGTVYAFDVRQINYKREG